MQTRERAHCARSVFPFIKKKKNTADTVSEALLRHVVPYFGTPRRLLSDRGREFVGEV